MREFEVGKVCDGGSFGADRVILNAANKYTGLIAHERADGNAFVGVYSYLSSCQRGKQTDVVDGDRRGFDTGSREQELCKQKRGIH